MDKPIQLNNRGADFLINEITNHIHPIVVHFPIVLIIVALIYDIVSTIRSKAIIPSRGIWLWLAAAASAWAAVITGPEDDARGNTTFLDIHSTLADFTAWVATLLVVFRLLMYWKNNKPFIKGLLAVYLIFSLLSCVLVLATGYYGGKMVYTDGVGVKVKGTPVNPPVSRTH
jgi:uncharacterized membrane protein